MLFSFRIHIGNFVLGNIRKVLLDLKSTKNHKIILVNFFHGNSYWNSLLLCCKMRFLRYSAKWDIPSFSLGIYCILYEVRSWIDRERKSIHQNAASGLSSISIFTIALKTRYRRVSRQGNISKLRKGKWSWVRWFYARKICKKSPHPTSHNFFEL